MHMLFHEPLFLRFLTALKVEVEEKTTFRSIMVNMYIEAKFPGQGTENYLIF